MKKVKDFIKKRYMLCILVVSFILLVIVFPAIEKKGTFSLASTENVITLDCPSSTAVADTRINDYTMRCVIRLNTTDNITNVTLNYTIPDGFTYDHFSLNHYTSIPEEQTQDDDFVVVSQNETGINVDSNGEYTTGEVPIGTLVMTFADDLEPNAEYEFVLTNISVTEVDNEGITTVTDLEDYTATVRIANNVATVEDISVEDALMDPEFAADVFEYTFIVPSDRETATIALTLTDDNATVTGTGTAAELQLHYGTNSYDLTVTSEDGTETTEYAIDIYREYDFSTEVYVYDADGDYIYTRNDNGDDIISNIEELDDDLHYNINDDNELEVVHGEEVIFKTKIVNFVSPYLIIEEDLYVSADETYQSLFQNLTSETLTFKVTDTIGNFITVDETAIVDGYKLKIYYDEDELDEYIFRLEDIQIEGLIIDAENNMIKRLPLGMTYAEFVEHFDTRALIMITDANGDSVNMEDVIKTGDIVTIVFTNSAIELKLSVLGDITGNGTTKINDVGMLYKYLKGRIELDPEFVAAGEITNDGNIKINDVGSLYKYLKGKIESLEDF